MARHLANHERREFTIGWERKAVVIEVLEQDGSLGVMLFLISLSLFSLGHPIT
jgi:hypothetical protein